MGEIKEKETVLVTAAAGATGSFAVQLAALAGCHVIGTCGSDDKVLLGLCYLPSAVRCLVSSAPCFSSVRYSMSSRSAPRPLRRIVTSSLRGTRVCFVSFVACFSSVLHHVPSAIRFAILSHVFFSFSF